MQCDHLCKDNLTLDTTELYEEPIVLFTAIVCNIVICQELLQSRRNVVSPGLTQNVKMRLRTESQIR